jgi:hypothetical protein
MTAYRNDVDALAARDEVLTRELADKQRELDVVQRMLVEAREAEAAEAKAHNVMVGRRRLRRVFVALGVLGLAAGAAGAMCISEGPDMVPACTADCAKAESPDEARFTAVLAGKGYARIDLEPRYPAMGGVETQAELHAVIGEAVEPWQPFMYTRDATVRPAVASNIYKGGEPEPYPEFATDGNGGVWRIVREEPLPVVAAPTGTGWTRKVWLLPAGTSFRGDLPVANPR